MFVTPDGIVTFEVKVYNPEGDPFINITTESDTLQYKHAAMANLLDSSQTSADWMSNAKEQSDTWLTLAQIMQGILEKGFSIPKSETQEYKMNQYHNLNVFFSELFMTSIPQEYFTRLLNSTSYCVMNQNDITSFIDLSIEKIKSSPDKPKKRM